MNFRLLGPLEVDDPAGEIRLDGKRRRLLLLRLLASPNIVLSDDQLADDVWDGRPPGGVVSTLASHISLIRQVLGKDRIRRRSGGYLIDVDPTEVDATCFSSEVDAGRAAWSSGDRSDARDLLTASLSRWRGPALTDAGESPWAVGPRTRWEELRRAAEEDLAEIRLQLGEHRLLVPALEDSVAAEPFREGRWAQLMLAMYRSGMQADALHVYQRARTLLNDELGLEPSVQLAQLEQSILRQDALLDWTGAARSNPPPRPSSGRARPTRSIRSEVRPSLGGRTIGRDRELAELLSLIPTRQVITLTGVGGIGKSRLAAEVFSRAEWSYLEGSRWVDLASLTDSAGVPGAVAGALGVMVTTPETTIDAVTEWLADRQELLVLDNCEHVLDSVAGLVDVIITRCPSVTVLATSRIPLGLPDEVAWIVQPLPPENSFALFEERMFQTDGNHSLGERDRDRIRQICERVDGHPLAIEIAAAQIRSQSIEDVLEAVPRRWQDDAPETVPARHRSLDDCVAWSLRLLDDESRRLFRDLSVFPSGFDVDATTTVCGDDAGAPRIPFELALLVNHSMIQIDRSTTSTRYRLLEVMREYGRDTDDSLLRQDELRRRHLAYYRKRAVETSRSVLGPGYHGNGSALACEWDNFRAALDYALKEGDLDSAVDLVEPFGQWAIRSLHSEHRLWLARCLELATSQSRVRPTLLALSAKWQGFSGEYGEARRLALEAIDAAAPDSAAAAMSWVVLTFSNGMLGRRREVLPALERAELALANCGDGFTFVEGHAVLHTIILVGAPDRREPHRDVVHSAALALDNVIANVIVHRMDVVEQIHGGRADKALRLLPGAIEAASRAQVTSIEMDLEAMTLLLMAPDDPTLDARVLRVLTALKAYDYGDTIWGVLELLGTVWAQRGMTDRAATVLGHLEANNRRYPNPMGQPLRIKHLDPVSEEPGAAAGLTAGAAMTRNDLINFAIGCLRSDHGASPGP